jgi:hypothetical protein
MSVPNVQLIACGAVLLLCCSRVCLASETPAGSPGRQVELIIGAKANEAALLEPSIREMLAPKKLTLVTTRKAVVTAQDVAAAIAPPTEATRSLARVLLDFTSPGQATLFLIDPRRGRAFVRRMPLPHGLDAVARAGARLVVEESVDAILEGREIGVSREEFERSVLPAPPAAEVPRAPAVLATAPTPNPTRLLLAAGYEVVAMGSGEYQQAARVALGARFARVQIAAAARLATPVSIAGDSVQTRLSTGAVSVSGAGRLASLGSLSVTAGLGAGLDFTRVESAVTAQDLQPAPAFWALGPLIQPFAQIERIFGRLSVAVAIFADIHPLAERYTVRTGGNARDVFVPSRIRPAAALLIGALF